MAEEVIDGFKLQNLMVTGQTTQVYQLRIARSKQLLQQPAIGSKQADDAIGCQPCYCYKFTGRIGIQLQPVHRSYLHQFYRRIGKPAIYIHHPQAVIMPALI